MPLIKNTGAQPRDNKNVLKMFTPIVTLNMFFLSKYWLEAMTLFLSLVYWTKDNPAPHTNFRWFLSMQKLIFYSDIFMWYFNNYSYLKIAVFKQNVKSIWFVWIWFTVLRLTPCLPQTLHSQCTLAESVLKVD